MAATIRYTFLNKSMRFGNGSAPRQVLAEQPSCSKDGDVKALVFDAGNLGWAAASVAPGGFAGSSWHKRVYCCAENAVIYSNKFIVNKFINL